MVVFSDFYLISSGTSVSIDDRRHGKGVRERESIY